MDILSLIFASLKQKIALSFMLNLATISPVSLPILPEYKRYPTDAELQQSTIKFNQWIKRLESDRRLASFIDDTRTTSEKHTLESFANLWSLIDPASAPFLGKWVRSEEEMAIYPSTNKAQVCLVFFYMTQRGYTYEFDLGTISNGKMYMPNSSNNVFFFKQGRFLGWLSNGILPHEFQPLGEFPYHSPRPLQGIKDLLSSSSVGAKKRSEITQKFKAAGCTDSLPQDGRH
jgi:hypothetical protein